MNLVACIADVGIQQSDNDDLRNKRGRVAERSTFFKEVWKVINTFFIFKDYKQDLTLVYLKTEDS